MKKNQKKQQSEKSKAGKAAFRLAAAGLCGVMISGCGSSVQTEEQLVIPRTEEQAGTGEDGVDTFGEGQAGQTKGTADNVAAQVQAPERYQAKIEDGNILLKADAEFEIPDAAGIKTKKVEARFFTQEDYDVVIAGLFDGAPLWDRDYEAMEVTHGFTVEELKKKIAFLEAEKENGVDGDAPYADKEETLNEQIAAVQAIVDTAEAEGLAEITEPIIRQVPAVVKQDDAADGKWSELGGYVTAGGADYGIYMLNHMDGEWRWTRFSAERSDGRGNYIYYGDSFASDEEKDETKEKKESAQIQPEEILAKAKEEMEQIGLEDFAIQGGEYFACYKEIGRDGKTEIDRIGYGAHAVRTIDGIPIRYTHQNGSSLASDESICWPYEELTIIYDADGLASFYWAAPYNITDLSAGYVFLLPFSDIQNIFEEMVIKKIKDSFTEEGDSIEISIDRVCLSYMRIREKNAAEGTLVPVWDFFGTQTYRKSNGEVLSIQDSEYENILTINAMDGTVVDRDFGY